jgi:putative phosphonate catabolism associated alcohol dehydrogenase
MKTIHPAQRSSQTRDPSTTSLPDRCNAAVFYPVERKLTLEIFDLPPPSAQEVVVRIESSAICGSDIHTFLGHRTPEKPLILGHESCGSIVHLGADVTSDSAGAPLAVGDRITWSIAANCGHCFYCDESIPQKCDSLFKYGHESVESERQLNGGFAEYVYLVPGSAIYRIPDALPTNSVVFANCATATIAAAHRTAQTKAGDAVLIQGAGLLGLCASAMAASLGARCIAVADTNADRLALARRFGATHTIQIDPANPDQLSTVAREIASPRGFDVAIEVCGQPGAIPAALPALRIGARYILAGCVFPGAVTSFDLRTVTIKLLRLIGLHNYQPADLLTAVQFLEANHRMYPFDQVIAREFSLQEISEAFAYAIEHKDILRVAIRP